MSDSLLWYNVGVFGKAGYAVPSWGARGGLTNNSTINELVDLAGRNIFAIMHSEDTRLNRPPGMTTILNVDRLYKRMLSLLNSRATPINEPEFAPAHVTPVPQIFKVYPTPYFLVKNPYLKRWGQMGLLMLSEMMQHQDNAKGFAISEIFAENVGKYLQQIYSNMAMELFKVPRAEALKSDFLLTETQIKAYNPLEEFTSTELIESMPPFGHAFTEDQLAVLAAGIPISNLPAMTGWPIDVTAQAAADLDIGGSTAPGTTTAAKTTAASPSLVNVTGT